jgi:hypothetical protein
MELERHPRFVRHRDGPVWIVLPVDDDWDSYVRCEAEDGHPVIAELRVLPRLDTPGVPAHRDRDADRWVQVTLGQAPESAVPSGGLTARALRRVHLGRAIELAYGQLEEWLERDQRYGRPLPSKFTREAVSVPRRPGRKGRDDRFYAVVAAAYVDALKMGSRQPVRAAARTLSQRSGGTYEPAYVRDLLHGARQRGLLTRPPKVRAGGELTEKALEALSEERGARR